MNPSLAVPAARQLPRIAVFGLITKGLIYLLLGIFVLLQAFNVSSGDNDKTGVLREMEKTFAGRWLLPFLVLGLVCYSIWRTVEAYKSARNKKWGKALRYFFSGWVYLLLAYSAATVFFHTSKSNEDSERQLADKLLDMPFGQWWTGAAALAIGAVGLYQLYYGLAGKYRDHVQKMRLSSPQANVLLASGVIGYVARGIVWLFVGFLMMRAAIHGSSDKAGDTGAALHYAGITWGTSALALIAVGLIAYGIFNFVRARYDRLY